MISADQFRRDLPEFSDAAKYPNSVVDYWIGIAGLFINQKRWGLSAADPWPTNAPYPKLTEYDFGVEMYVAHNVVLERQAVLASAKNGIPGLVTGPMTSKSVDKVSAGYDTKAAIEEGAGYWNLTIYGLRFYRQLRWMGAGAYQLGIGFPPPYSGQAWPGPWPYPSPTGFTS